MKITIYELLGMVKDGKAPKKVKWGDTKYTLYIDEDTKQKYYQDDKCRYFFLTIRCLNDLNDTVEILEEEKKIPEKIEIYEDEDGHYFIDNHCKKIYITCDEVNFMVEEFNQLIDYLKSKGE